MGITLRKRSRARPAPPHEEIVQAERAALTTLAETLQRLAADLPERSPLAGELARVARSIEVAGVLGVWRLDDIVPAEPTTERVTTT